MTRWLLGQERVHWNTQSCATEVRLEAPRPCYLSFMCFLYAFYLKCLHTSLDAERVLISVSPWPSRRPAPAHQHICCCWKDRLEMCRSEREGVG